MPENTMTRVIFVANRPNDHNEIYSPDVLKKAIEKYKTDYIDTNSAFGVVKTSSLTDGVFSRDSFYSHKCVSIVYDETSDLAWSTIEFLKNDSSYSPMNLLSDMRLNGVEFVLTPEGNYTFHEDDHEYRIIDSLEIKAINISIVPRRFL